MASPDLIHFLLVFDHEKGALITEASFVESEDAVLAYSKYEEEYQDDDRIEVVLVASDSIETIRHTHANYFADVSESSSRFLAGI